LWHSAATNGLDRPVHDGGNGVPTQE
jgi:hypothetical protein